ncbi:unnamed protein product [Miscanthus lutarioriparius]|uniref:DUF220 domain-containing protein n=1 Tax=Miscanthus lutarioriparius TaxID=422564 RepID=A0A811NCD3_9POAL|nr:unnamed protein product [Miscanthus lutarioriparius]
MRLYATGLFSFEGSDTSSLADQSRLDLRERQGNRARREPVTATELGSSDLPRRFWRLPSTLGHSCFLPVLCHPGIRHRDGAIAPAPRSGLRCLGFVFMYGRICSRALGFLMGDSSRQEPWVKLQADGWLRRPALGLNSLMQIPDKIQSSLKVHFGRFLNKDGHGRRMSAEISSEKAKQSCSAAAAAASAEIRLDRQLQAWWDNPSWTDEPPEIKVTVPEGSLCNINLRFKAGLPPDAVYNIIIDPENKRVFKNIKEVISRKVLLDEGSRQIVEVEQAAIWKFLWWSGILSVHVFVDQNRKNHTVKFRQGRTGFMRKFEGCWKIEPLFVDKELCLPLDPHTLEEYESCTGGRGRVGSAITLDQLIEPALLPPPPISWYLRGITTRTTEMLVNDLIAETARLRGISNNAIAKQVHSNLPEHSKEKHFPDCQLPERWINGLIPITEPDPI